jgi:non-ribosomal peptide synthetase component F
MIAIATTAAYIHYLTGLEEIVLGLPVSTRLTPVSRNTPCMLANELPLRLTVHPTMSLLELVRQVSEQVGLVLKHQRYRGEYLHRELRYSSGNQDLYSPVVNVISFDDHINKITLYLNIIFSDRTFFVRPHKIANAIRTKLPENPLKTKKTRRSGLHNKL